MGMILEIDRTGDKHVARTNTGGVITITDDNRRAIMEAFEARADWPEDESPAEDNSAEEAIEFSIEDEPGDTTARRSTRGK